MSQKPDGPGRRAFLWLENGLSRLYDAYMQTYIGETMQKRMTISIDEAVYEGLVRVVGRRKISRFIEDLARPHVVNDDLADGYRAMAADTERERDALEWSEALVGDAANAARGGLVGGFRPVRWG